MAQLVFDKAFLADFGKLEHLVRQKVAELPGKFEVATHSGVHLEKMNNPKDDRVRTVRVDKFWRGVVVALGEGKYVLLRVMPHDDAIDWARKQKFKVNPATGIVELIDISTVSETADRVIREAEGTDSRPGLFEEIPDKTFKQLGVDEELLPILRRLHDEAELYAIASLLPKAQGDAVLLLADGKSPEEVWKELASDYDLDEEPVDTDDIDKALERPGSRAEFIVTSNDQELIELLSGDFEAWRMFLHPSQRVLAEKPVYNGPAKVTGGAGTGKTVVAIHRARFLAQQLIEEGDESGRILVATYTTSLQRNLERTLKSLCSPEEYKRLQVSTIDSMAYQTLMSEGIKIQPAGDEMVRNAAESIVIENALDQHGLDARFLVAEWRHVILGRDLRTLAQYATTIRPGRGRALQRAARKAVWAAIQKLSDRLAESNSATYEQIADQAADILKARSVPFYRHAIIDESQDLNPSQWRLIRAAVRPGVNDLFIVGDAHQRIYDSRVSLSSLGIETRGRSRRLKINYRTSQQILSWSLGILSGQVVDDLDGNEEKQSGYRSEFQGPAPVVQVFDTAVEEAAHVAETISGWLEDGIEPSAIGVVGRTREDSASVGLALNHQGITWSEVGKGAKGLSIGTMHASKGLEFERLVLVGAGADRVPLVFAVTSEADDPVQHGYDMQRERCLLYVACTRARDALLVTSVGAPSKLLPGM